MSWSFPAKYDGECSNECGERILVGDEVEYIDNELFHVECVTREQKPRPVCGQCFMEVAMNGSCECGDAS